MWGGVRWAGGGSGGGWRAGAFSHKPASAPTSYSGKTTTTTTTQYHSSSSARSEQADSVSQHEWVIEVICRGAGGMGSVSKYTADLRLPALSCDDPTTLVLNCKPDARYCLDSYYMHRLTFKHHFSVYRCDKQEALENPAALKRGQSDEMSFC